MLRSNARPVSRCAGGMGRREADWRRANVSGRTWPIYLSGPSLIESLSMNWDRGWLRGWRSLEQGCISLKRRKCGPHVRINANVMRQALNDATDWVKHLPTAERPESKN